MQSQLTRLSAVLVAALLSLAVPGTADALAGSPLGSASAVDAIAASAATSPVRVEGWISRVTARGGVHTLECITPEGHFAVVIGPHTMLESSDGMRLDVGDLAAGMTIRAVGTVVPESTAIEAAEIRADPAPPTRGGSAVAASGRIAARFEAGPGTSQRRLLVLDGAGSKAVVEVRPDTRIVDAAGVARTWRDLQPGTSVAVLGQGDVGQGDDATVAASELRVLPPPRRVRLRVEGVLRARSEETPRTEAWIVGTARVFVDAGLAGSAGVAVGGRVVLTAERRPDGALVAGAIVGLPSNPERVELRGTLEANVESILSVDGMPVVMVADTEVVGNLEVGELVHVSGEPQPSGALRASEVRAILASSRPVYFEGEIEATGDGRWRVAGVELEVAPMTVLRGIAPRRGLYAEVVGNHLPDGSVVADTIVVSADAFGDQLVLEGRLLEMDLERMRLRVRAVTAMDSTRDVEVAFDATTIVDESGGPLRRNARVQIRAEQIDGDLYAVSVRVFSGGDAPLRHPPEDRRIGSDAGPGSTAHDAPFGATDGLPASMSLDDVVGRRAQINELDMVVDRRGTVHLVWEESGQLWHSELTEQWSVPERVAAGESPALALDAWGEANLVFANNFAGRRDIYHVVYDEGLWTLPVNISNTGGYSAAPSAAPGHDGRPLVVAWSEIRPGMQPLVHFGRLEDGAWHHAPVFQARGVGPVVTEKPRRAIAWHGPRAFGAADDVFAIFGRDEWSLPENVSDSPGQSAAAAIASDSHGVHIGWNETATGAIEVAYSRRLDGGWSAINRLGLSDGAPPMLVANLTDTRHAVWIGSGQVWVARSLGRAWWARPVQSEATGATALAATAASDGALHLAFASRAAGQTTLRHGSEPACLRCRVLLPVALADS